MTSNSSPSCKGIHYSYLLFCENGSILPLVAVYDLPSTVTVLPPLDVVNGITLVQKIPRPRPSSSLGAPEMGFLAGTEKTKAAVTATEEETACSSVFQAASSSSSSPVPSSVVSRIRDAMQTHIVFPNDLSPPPSTLGEDAAFALSSSKSGMLYAPPHPSEPTTAPGPAVHAPLSAPTRESLVNGFKPCSAYLSSGTCFWGAACTFRHDLSVPKSERLFFNSDMDDDGGAGEDSAASTTETLCSSIEEEGDDGTGKGKKLRSTEPCAYFHRKVGCKRGKDCFYAHGKDGSTTLAGDKHVPIQRPTLTASNNKLEGEWRRLEPQSPRADNEKDSENKEVATTREVAIDRKVRLLPPPLPSCCMPHGPHMHGPFTLYTGFFLSIEANANQDACLQDHMPGPWSRPFRHRHNKTEDTLYLLSPLR